MENDVKYVIDNGKNKFAAYDANIIDSLLEEKASNEALNSAVENLEGEIEQKANTEYVNEEISRVESIIEDLPEPMIFKGTLGTGGTIQELPNASASNEGFTYKVITAGTYAGQSALVGDVFISDGSEWVLVPAGDDFNDTWRAIKVNGVEKLGNGISSGAVDFVGSENIEVEFDANGNKVGIKTKNIYTKNEVDDIVYNILPDDTASGSVANFETDLALPVKSLEVDVNAVQDLHGYDYPWTAGGGKNVYPPITPDTKNGITLTNDNGVITINGTATADTYFDIDNLNIALPSGSKLYLCAFNSVAAETRLSLFLITNNIGNPQVNMNNANAILDTTISADAIGTCLRFRVPNGATYSNFKLSPYLQIGGNAPTSFSPYENICPISGVSEINAVHCHKNLYQYDENKVSTGTTTISTIRAYYPLGFKGVTSLTFSASLKSGSSIAQSDYLNIGRLRKSDGLLETLSAFITPSGITTRTLSISSDDEVVLMSLENPTVIKSILSRYDIQIEVGSSASTFEPFNGITEVINLGGTYYGGHFTQDKNGHRQFEATHVCKTYNGSEEKNWGSYSQSNNRFRYWVSLSDCKLNANGEQISNYLKPTNGDVSSGNSAIIRNNPASITLFSDGSRFYVNVTNVISADTKEEWLSYLSTNNLTIVYPIATPIIIDLPDGEPINTLAGVNNFFADSGNITVTFKQSVNDAINAAVNAANNSRTLGAVNTAKSEETEFEKPEEIEEPKEETKK